MNHKTDISYSLSESFKNFVTQVSEGIISGNQLDQILCKIEAVAHKHYFDKSAEANLIRIISSVIDKKSFLLDSLNYDHHLEIICAISSLSNYLTDILVRNPEYLHMLFDQQILSSEINEESLSNDISNSVNKFKSLQTKTKMLRNLKRKYILKIGTSDILGFTTIIQTTEYLSILAKSLSAALFEICYKEICIKYKMDLPNNYALCSLGKLGGNELNYSSDIDLILFYEKNYEIEGINKDYHELISEAVQLFVKESTALTSVSYLYRVDFRLRPDGRNSLLCRTIADYIRYYETRGEDWERQMLIKLGFVAGNYVMYSEFKNYIDGFIFPRSLRGSVIETIQRMKQSIESALNDDNNIKLIPGGIRDIEFAVQALQLMNGGKKSSLKTGSTLNALSELKKHSLITDNEFNTLNVAYIIYRKIEHFVQLMNDKQTHSLPENKDLLLKLSRFLDFQSIDKFRLTIEEYRKSVREIYESVIINEHEEDQNVYGLINFKDHLKAKSNVKFLSYGFSLIGEKQFEKTTSAHFHKIESQLIIYLQHSISPDLVLDNFVKIIRNVRFPSLWYSTFSDELFFKSFLHMCEYSQKSVDSIASSRSLGDLFLSKKVFQSIIIDNETDLNKLLFSLTIQNVSGKINFPQFSTILSEVLTKKIKSTIEQFNFDYSFFIAGLGSFANRELTFGSDIDLIVVADNLSENITEQNDFQQVLLKLRENLKPFKVDFRLRPEGKSSPLVWDLNGYAKYINSRIRVWELQALSKLRFIYGNEELFSTLVEDLTQKVSTYSEELVYNEILKMYKSKLSFSYSNQVKIDIKNSPGALITMDTIIGFLLLKNPKNFYNYINTDSIEKLKLIEQVHYPVEFMKFRENHLLLKSIQISLQILFNQNKSTLPNDREKLNRLAVHFGFKEFDPFIKKINSVFKENIDMLNIIRDLK